MTDVNDITLYFKCTCILRMLMLAKLAKWTSFDIIYGDNYAALFVLLKMEILTRI